jgi:hypothetical protein
MTTTRPKAFAIPRHARLTSCRSCETAIAIVVTATGELIHVEAVGEKRGQDHAEHCTQVDLFGGKR